MPEIPHQLQVLGLAIIFDLLIGEPPNAVHPVAWLGKVISLFQRLAPRQGRIIPLLAGAAFVIVGMVGVAAIGLFCESVASRFPFPIAVIAAAVALKFMFSIRGLSHAGYQVQSALDQGDLQAARRLLSWHLVSRDTTALDESQVAAATIESLSENASDSFIAPLLFYAVGGLPAVFAYRFINTCDAMLGYRDAQREWLGKTAARVDDLANLVPARLTAALIILAGFVMGKSPFRAAYIWSRDRNRTASPNAGHPMSAAAGVLGIQLEKIGHYQLGWGQRKPVSADVARAQWMLWSTATIGVIVLAAMIFVIRQFGNSVIR